MTRREFLAVSAAITFAPAIAVAQKEDFFTGRDVFARIMDQAKAGQWQKLQMGDLVGQVAKTFIGTPYVGHTFEIFDDREVCVINLKGLDCATFYEASLALARTIKTGRLTESEFQKQTTRIRYRGGKLKGYVSRLHYAIDYFHDNEEKGIVQTISDDIPGALLYPRKISFMTKNFEKYRQLKANPALVPEITKTEDEINFRRNFYIPKEKVGEIEILLKTGDLLGLTTTTEGLDVSHTGLCYRDETDTLRFMHASSVKKEVILDGRLSDYLTKSKINDGIIVARPLELS
ncbi:MAG: DUF1460 domain-containing protein [Chlorobia bacterium]|nr:DUF1460 domain-containing protein [Fimbriimonadaceae bacterium]